MKTRDFSSIVASHVIDASGPAPEAEIVAAENRLGVRFPKPYRDLVSSYRTIVVNGQEVVGLPAAGGSAPDVVSLNERHREGDGLPDDVLLFYERGDGDCYGFDLASSGDGTEPRIVVWPHGGRVAVGDLEVVADSLEEIVREWNEIDLGDPEDEPIVEFSRPKSRLP